MTSFHLQSLFFAVLVLGLVSIGREGGSDSAFLPRVSEVAQTSFTAEASSFYDPDSMREGREERTLIFAEPEPAKEKRKPPLIGAHSAIAFEIGSPYPIYEKDAERHWPLASLTKLMTAAVAAETFAVNAPITVGERAVATEGVAGGFNAGEIVTAHDLIGAMLIASSNDAASALAEAYGTDAFIQKMRAKAFSLGMHQSSFFDASGLSVLNQSTGRDLEKLIRYLIEEEPAVFALSAAREAIITDLVTGRTRKIVATNEFAGKPGFVGGKTGYTNEANGNLLSVFEAGGRRFLIVVFGTSDRFGETEKLWRWVEIQT